MICSKYVSEHNSKHQKTEEEWEKVVEESKLFQATLPGNLMPPCTCLEEIPRFFHFRVNASVIWHIAPNSHPKLVS